MATVWRTRRRMLLHFHIKVTRGKHAVLCRWSCSSCSRGALYCTFLSTLSTCSMQYGLKTKLQKLHQDSAARTYIQPALFRSIRVCCPSLCPGRKMKDDVELWHILFQWAHPNTDRTHSVTTELLGGRRGRERLFLDNRVGASTKREGGGSEWQQGLDIQHLCGFLGHADVRWWAGILVVYQESWEAANHSVISHGEKLQPDTI